MSASATLIALTVASTEHYPDLAGGSLRACLSVRFQGFTPTPPYRPSASSRLWPTRATALRLPDPCGLGSDSHGGNVFSGKLLEFLTQTGSKRLGSTLSPGLHRPRARSGRCDRQRR